jgi:hypothetical protein
MVLLSVTWHRRILHLLQLSVQFSTQPVAQCVAIASVNTVCRMSYQPAWAQVRRATAEEASVYIPTCIPRLFSVAGMHVEEDG